MVNPEDLTYDERGLLPAIVQDATTKQVLMLAWVDAEAVRRTLDSGTTWFWSRSRREYWNKGATSGNTQAVRALRLDCDGDALLVLVEKIALQPNRITETDMIAARAAGRLRIEVPFHDQQQAHTRRAVPALQGDQ